MKNISTSIRLTFFMMLLLGLAYPLLVTGISQIVFPKQANGSLIYENGLLRGSELIAQNFEKPEYFWPRPSAVSFNPLPSGGSNLGPTSQSLQAAVKARRDKLKLAHPGETEPPQHLLFASGSGLDPDQSIAAIQYQASRVAAARGMTVAELQQMIDFHKEPRQLGFLGEEKVNVLILNRALDALQKAPSAGSGEVPNPSSEVAK